MPLTRLQFVLVGQQLVNQELIKWAGKPRDFGETLAQALIELVERWRWEFAGLFAAGVR